MKLAALIRGKRNTDDTRPANANLTKVATIPVYPEDIAPKLAGLAVAEPDNHVTKASIENILWPPKVQALVDWFLNLESREIKPFHLESHIHVTDPLKFFEALRREIKTGEKGARAKMGTLQSDLLKLKEYLR